MVESLRYFDQDHDWYMKSHSKHTIGTLVATHHCDLATWTMNILTILIPYCDSVKNGILWEQLEGQLGHIC